MISSIRIETLSDKPDGVEDFIEHALRRLGLSGGTGPLLLGAHELVIEGTESGGYRGRAKFNFGPMSAVAERMWLDGKSPFDADHEEYERLRAEANVEHAKAEAKKPYEPPKITELIQTMPTQDEKAGQDTP